MAIYLGITGAASTLNDIYTRVTYVTAIYWLVITIIIWLPDKFKQLVIQPVLIIGAMLIIENYLLLGGGPDLVLIPLQLILLGLFWWLNHQLVSK